MLSSDQISKVKMAKQCCLQIYKSWKLHHQIFNLKNSQIFRRQQNTRERHDTWHMPSCKVWLIGSQKR